MSLEPTDRSGRLRWLRRWTVPRVHGLPVVVAAAVVLAVAGATSTVSFGWISSAKPGLQPAHASTTATGRPSIVIVGAKSGVVPWTKHLSLTVRNGSITAISIIGPHGRLAGRLTSSSWTSKSTLTPHWPYKIRLSYADAAGRLYSRAFTVPTTDVPQHVKVSLSPDGSVVGVGQPIVASFSDPVPTAVRAKVLRAMVVTTTPAVTGAWHWLSPYEAHWRPPTYWKPGTHVQVTAAISAINFGDNTWGDATHSADFRIGDAHVSTVDVAKHTMTIRDNGKIIKVVPVSAGRDKYPTKSGVHIALSKSQMVIMDSATVGIPRNSPDGYYEKVYWDVRISNGGAFVHAAPWSMSAQGHRNVSHGCVNISTANATWFYHFSQRGDVVNIINSGASPDTSDAGMADWNMSWQDWVNG
jgi:lipoprotein-anchoring transpeptidase ErfK/SrfK